MIRLGVNIDHVATLRQARGTAYPDPVSAAHTAVEAGADGITLHLREDRRHIQDNDVERLKESLTVPMNLEMAVTEEMVNIALRIKPEHCCLVPERREELTTEGGLDVINHEEKIKSACHRLSDAGCEVSLFIDAEEASIDAAIRIGAPVIELHTGGYADATDTQEMENILGKITRLSRYAHEAGLQVNAGHGLHYQNVMSIARIPELVELNIGHSIVAHALTVGMKEAVAEMKALLGQVS